ncbi:hypothetical protein GGI42DRAFT_271327 [Trichoderma sp. SZMC 28013]
MAEVEVPKNNQAQTLEAAANSTLNRPYNSKTFRIRGVPLTWDSKQLQGLLQTSSGDAQPRVSSLAVEVNKRTQTGTVTFMKASQQLQDRKTWNIPVSSDLNQIEDGSVNLDDGFTGITTLYSPPPEEHNIE